MATNRETCSRQLDHLLPVRRAPRLRSATADQPCTVGRSPHTARLGWCTIRPRQPRSSAPRLQQREAGPSATRGIRSPVEGLVGLSGAFRQGGRVNFPLASGIRVLPPVNKSLPACFPTRRGHMHQHTPGGVSAWQIPTRSRSNMCPFPS